MGTRCLTHIKPTIDGPTITTIYRQSDGYPDGHGQDVYKALGSKVLVNGILDPETNVNGMGCAAATLIASLKEGAGNIYVYPPDSYDAWEDYTYILYGIKAKLLSPMDSDEIQMRVYSGNLSAPVIYDGPLSKFDEFEEKEEEED